VNPVHLPVSPDRPFLLVANHNSGTVASIAILPDNSLGQVVGMLSFTGKTSPHRRDQNSSKPHPVVFDDTGHYALIPDKGLDSIFTISMDPDGSMLWLQDRTVRLREMSGPRHLAFSPSKQFVYSVQEFLSTITVSSWDAEGGILCPFHTLASLPDPVTGDSRGAEIVVSPHGNHVYVSNRSGPGDHSPGGDFPDTIGAYNIDRQTGPLYNGRWTETHEIRPQFFCLDAGRDALLVAHERDTQLLPTPSTPRPGLPVRPHSVPPPVAPSPFSATA
jgi:6-phosphogluconolactonase